MKANANLTATEAPLLSIVTVCRNAEATLRATIESVLGQTFKDYEYIVVDGLSTDSTLKILHTYTDRLRYISEPDNGYTSAINKGIKLARGKWIHLINADDCYDSPESLAKLVPQLKEDRFNYCTIMRTWPDGSSKPLPLKYERHWLFRGKKWSFWITTSMLHPAMVISKAQYVAVGPYNEKWRFSADIDMILKLFKHYRLHFIPMVLVRMQQEGMAQQHRSETAREFAEITVEHGLPRVLAEAVYQLKMKILIPLLLLTDRLSRKR